MGFAWGLSKVSFGFGLFDLVGACVLLQQMSSSFADVHARVGYMNMNLQQHACLHACINDAPNELSSELR